MRELLSISLFLLATSGAGAETAGTTVAVAGLVGSARVKITVIARRPMD